MSVSFASPFKRLILNCRSRARKHVADVEPHGVFMRILGRTRSHIPRIAEEVSPLEHGLECSEFRIPPPGLRPSDGRFLSGLVLAVGRAGVAVTDQRLSFGIGGVVRSAVVSAD